MFEASLDYTVSLCLKTDKERTNGGRKKKGGPVAFVQGPLGGGLSVQCSVFSGQYLELCLAVVPCSLLFW